jgi:transcriptional regulator with XRE-family HTH domain
MHNPSWLENLTSTPEDMAHFQQERVILDATERICELMEEAGVSRADLAKRLNKSRSYVTQLLSGRTNMTLRTLSDLYSILGRSLVLMDSPIGLSVPHGGAIHATEIGQVRPEHGQDQYRAYGRSTADIIPFEGPRLANAHEPDRPNHGPRRTIGGV